MSENRTRADWSGRRDLNPRPSPWQGDALPLSYSRWVLFEYIGTHSSGQRAPGAFPASSHAPVSRQAALSKIMRLSSAAFLAVPDKIPAIDCGICPTNPRARVLRGGTQSASAVDPRIELF